MEFSDDEEASLKGSDPPCCETGPRAQYQAGVPVDTRAPRPKISRVGNSSTGRTSTIQPSDGMET